MILYELRGYLAEYKVSEAEMLFYSLSQFSYSNDLVVELIHRAEEQMMSYDYNDVNATLDEIISLLYSGTGT